MLGQFRKMVQVSTGVNKVKLVDPAAMGTHA